jgi:hypothetical protein
MMIFQRMITFQGPPQEVVPWALDMTELVNDKTHLNVSLWQGMYGGPLGTLVWSTLIDNSTTLEVATDALATDADYLALGAKAQDWVGSPGEDRLLRVAHTAGGEYVRPGVGAYAEGTVAVPAPGQLVAASTWGVEISDMVSEQTHATVLFGNSTYSAFGELVWIGLYESAAELDRAAEVLGKDEDYAKSIDAAGDLFQPGTARRTLGRRIA